MNFIDEQIIRVGKTEIMNYLPEIGINTVRDEIIAGLKSQPKYVSPKYFYDQVGSELFEEITHLDEYYPSQCEKEILSTIVSKLGLDFFELDIIELGSGDSSKIKTIFSQIQPDILTSINYYPVDISRSAIENSVHNIVAEFNLNRITGIVTDFLHHHQYMPRRKNRLFCFLGSTIGNFTTTEVEDFMKKLGKIMEKGDGLLLGVDMVKDVAVLESAYNDKKGLTADFNKNILNVLNRHIQANFDINDFDHLAFYNREKNRIEMHLTAKRSMEIAIGYNGETICMKKGERLHTENSCKFTHDRLEEIGALGHMKLEQIFSDAKGWFSLVHFKYSGV